MIEIFITPDMLQRAKEKSIEMSKINNSICSGEGNLAGFIGEQAANEVIKGKVNNTYDYDILDQIDRWDVKTKRCTTRPRPNYECSVAAFNTRQHCTKYAFVRLLHEGSTYIKAYILGWLPKDEYFGKAKFLKKGDLDLDNNFIVRADCYNVKISDLNEFSY